MMSISKIYEQICQEFFFVKSRSGVRPVTLNRLGDSSKVRMIRSEHLKLVHYGTRE